MKRKSACLAKDYGKKRWTNQAIDIANLISENKNDLDFTNTCILLTLKGVEL